MTGVFAVDVPFPQRHELGEMPHWDAARRRLTYVDINAGSIHELDPATGELVTVAISAPLSFAVPVAGSATRLCGNGNDLIAVDATGLEVGRMPVERGKPGNRFNEGKADPRGRLWTGSMSKAHEPGQAALYRLDHSGLTTVGHITLGNGTDWDVERRRMYHVDSTTHQVDFYDYDVEAGAVENRRTWVSIDPAEGLPDGLTVDADGCVWLCLFGAGVVRRFDPDGTRIADVELPTRFPTCPVFGGEGLSTIFVTTSRHKLTPDQRTEQPIAGALLVIDAGVAGRPCNEISPSAADHVMS